MKSKSILFILLMLGFNVFLNSQASSFCGALPPHTASSNNPDSIYFDRFGNSYDMQEESNVSNMLLKSSNGSNACLAGHFELVFFSIEKQYEDIIIMVFEELSQLILRREQKDECDNVINVPPIKIRITDQSLPMNQLGIASPFFNPHPGVEGCDQYKIYDQIYMKLMGVYSHFRQTPFDGILTIDSSKEYDTSYPMPIDPNSNGYDFYTIIWHQAMHLIAFNTALDLNGWITNYELLLHSQNGQIFTNTNCDDECFNFDQNSLPGGVIPPCSIRVGDQGPSIAAGIPTFASLTHLAGNSCSEPNYLMSSLNNLNTGERLFIHEDEIDILCLMKYQTNNCDDDCYVVSSEYASELYGEYSDCCTNIFHTCADFLDIDYEDILCRTFSPKDIEIIDIYSPTNSLIDMHSSNFRVYKGIDPSTNDIYVTYSIIGCPDCEIFTSTVIIAFDEFCQYSCPFNPCENLFCYSDFSSIEDNSIINLGYPFQFIGSHFNSPDIDEEGLRFGSESEAVALKVNGDNRNDCDYIFSFDVKGTDQGVEFEIWLSNNPPCHTNDRQIPRECDISFDCENYEYTSQCFAPPFLANEMWQRLEIEIPKEDINIDLNFIIILVNDFEFLQINNIDLIKKCGHPEFSIEEVDCPVYDFIPGSNAYLSYNWLISDNDQFQDEINFALGSDGLVQDYEFPVNGNYTITLTVTDECGNSSSSSQEVVVDCIAPQFEACGNTDIDMIVDVTNNQSLSQVINDIPHSTYISGGETYHKIEDYKFYFDKTPPQNSFRYDFEIDLNVEFENCVLLFHSKVGFNITENVISNNSVYESCESRSPGLLFNNANFTSEGDFFNKLSVALDLRNGSTMWINNGTLNNADDGLGFVGVLIGDDSTSEIYNCNINESTLAIGNNGTSTIDNTIINGFDNQNVIKSGIANSGIIEIINCELSGLNQAISSSSVSADIINTTIYDSEFGIFIEDAIDHAIEGCDITCEKQCIDVFDDSELIISNNPNITTNGPPIFDPLLNLTLPNYASPIRIRNSPVKIENNVIIKDGTIGSAIYLLGTRDNVVIKDNDITGGGTFALSHRAAVDNSGSRNGVYFEDNLVYTKGSAGIFNLNSASTDMICNEIMSTSYSSPSVNRAIANSTDSDNAFLLGNTMDASLDLYTNSTIRDMNHKANCFENRTVVADGYSLLDLQLLGMVAFVDESDEPCYFPNSQTPNGWFENELGDSEMCTGSPGYDPPFTEDDTTQVCKFLEYLDGQLQDSTSRNQAIMRIISLFRTMYDSIQIEDGLKVPKCLEVYLDTTSLCGIKTLLTLDSLTDIAILGSDTIRLQIQIQTTITFWSLQQWRSYNANGEGNSQAQKDNLWQQYLIELQILRSLIQIRRIEEEAIWTEIDSIQIEECLDSITTIEVLAYKLMSHSDSLTTSDSLIIDTYASKCAHKYGRGVHLMRALAAQLNQVDYRKFDENCQSPPIIPKIAPSHNKYALETDLNIYPNPASDHIVISFSKNTKLESLSVTNISGRHIMNIDLKFNYKRINTIDWSQGMYYFIAVYENKETEVRKIFIEK